MDIKEIEERLSNGFYIDPIMEKDIRHLLDIVKEQRKEIERCNAQERASGRVSFRGHISPSGETVDLGEISDRTEREDE